MRNNTSRVIARTTATSLAGCIALILHGTALAAAAGDEPEEIVVSASRRNETVSKAPYNISAYSGDQLQSANIASVTALSQQVPNFVVQDTGARNAAASVPIIRGLNASAASLGSDQPRSFQSSVGMYLGNTSMVGSLPLMDIQRVEVLRGPQGTLYGSGTLAGAVRLVPIAPELGKFAGTLSASASRLNHSSDTGYDASGAVNLPLGDTAALRLVAKYQNEAGYIDQYNIMRREGNNYASGVPILANPADVAGSQPVYFDKKDENYTRTKAARATLLWQPADAFKLEVAYNYGELKGFGAPRDNPTFEGGIAPQLSATLVRPATGEYEVSQPSLEPFNRKTHLVSVDPSYDLGFATLAGTFSYGKTDGSNVFDNTANIMSFVAFAPYYAGFPFNPRVVIPQLNGDDEKTKVAELRLVSNGENTIDYVAGIYFQDTKRTLRQTIFDPGIEEQTAAANEGVPTVVPDPGGIVTRNVLAQHSKDTSLYGNLTWHVTDRWQVTGGARFFRQTFDGDLKQRLPLFGIETAVNSSQKVNSQIFMANTSYEINDTLKGYGTWSQGFRRGGANAIPTEGPLAESTVLLQYQPDKTNNFEAGVKGKVGELYFSAAVFYVRWSNPQIDLLTPHLQYPVVVNANAATSKGFELETSGPLGIDGLTFNLGLAYSKARLTEDFSLPANNGAGEITDGGIVGQSGDRLPGTPDFSGTVNVNYAMELSNGAALKYTLGADYRGSTLNILPNLNPDLEATTQPGYAMLHADVELSVGSWRYALYVTNLTDKRVVYSVNPRTLENQGSLGNFGNSFNVSKPREIGLRVSYDW